MSVPSTTLKLARDFSSWREANAEAGKAAMADNFKRAVERGKVARMYAYECVVCCKMLGVDPVELSPTMADDASDYEMQIHSIRVNAEMGVA